MCQTPSVPTWQKVCARIDTHLDDVGMLQFTEVLDLPDGRHVEAILELAHLDLLNGDLATRRELPAWKRRKKGGTFMDAHAST